MDRRIHVHVDVYWSALRTVDRENVFKQLKGNTVTSISLRKKKKRY